MVSLRTRVFLAFLVILGASLYMLINWLLDDVRPQYLETMEESMVDQANMLAALLEQHITGGAIDVNTFRAAFDAANKRRFAARIYAYTKTGLNTRVYVVDAAGIVLFDSDGGRDEGRDYSQWNDVIRTLRGDYGARTSRVNPDDPLTSILFVAAPVMRNGAIAGVLTVCRPAESVTLFIQNAKRKIVISGILAGLMVILLGMVFTAWISRPVEKLTAYAHAVRDGRKVPPPRLGRSEMAVLGRAFEEMRDALEGRQYVERYIQTLTHEMKSPLSAIKGAAELLTEEMAPDQQTRFIANISTETARIQALIDRLLRLAALESRKALKDIEPVDMRETAADVAESLQPLAEAEGITLSLDWPDPVTINGERFLLRQTLSNLVQNALNFTLAGGRVTITGTAAGGFLEIRITDTGTGIPSYALERIYDRFYSLARPDTGRKGTGLGLAFVREAVHLHQGTVTIANRPEQGVEALIRLPLN